MSDSAQAASHGIPPVDAPYTVLLGIAQDGGYPAAGCRKPCCERAWSDPAQKRHAACLGIIDPLSGQRWLVECTPDFREQLHTFDLIAPPAPGSSLDGILLTHAHIGHYTGLIHLGREAMGVRGLAVHAMPGLCRFLADNGPWSQLARLKNIVLKPLAADVPLKLNARITVTPFVVPHRDEYSETVGFRITGPHRSSVFIPDIDKWERWATPIEDVIAEADCAYLDGTFFDAAELPGCDMSVIPHPFIAESIVRFTGLPESERAKVRFIHFNHSNPVLDEHSPATRLVTAAGHQLAAQGEICLL